MNKKAFGGLLTIIMVAMLCVSITSCGADDDESSSSGYTIDNDPDGTILVNLTNYGDTYPHYGFIDGEVGNLVEIKTSYGHRLFYLAMSTSNNFNVAQINQPPYIVNVGKVKNLNDIKHIPSEVAGWAKQAAVLPGYGYVCKTDGDWGKYLRIYVQNYIEGTNGGIIGATIKYQIWSPKDK